MSISNRNILKTLIIAAGIFAVNCGNLEFQESSEAAEESSHYPGEDCGSCHGNQAREFTVSGTLYTDATGTTVAPGGIVVIRNVNGTELFRMTADAAGNFYTNTILVYPAKAESLSSQLTMAQTFSNTGRSCNQSGCHDSSRRIY